MLTTVVFSGFGREESQIVGKEEGRKLSNLTKRFGKKAGEGEEKLEHSSSAKRLRGGGGENSRARVFGSGPRAG